MEKASPRSLGDPRPQAPLLGRLIARSRLGDARAPVLFGVGFLAFGCAVVANAMVMQPSRHPAPLFAPAVPPARAAARVATPLPPERPVIQASARTAVEADTLAERPSSDRMVLAKASARPTETGALGTLPPRGPDAPAPADKGLLVVQQALIKAGFGPAKADGLLGRETRASIERFERERRLPVTGEPSPKLLRELGVARQPRT